MGKEPASHPYRYMDYNLNELAEVLAELSHSAQEGDPEAQWGLGELYYFGKGVGQDRREAMRLWRQAAEKGLAVAQFELGIKLINAGGGPEHQEGITWLRHAAQQGSLYGNGSAPAHLFLGVLYEDGDGVAQDYQEAVKWYTEAAQLGDRVGQYNLGSRIQF